MHNPAHSVQAHDPWYLRPLVMQLIGDLLAFTAGYVFYQALRPAVVSDVRTFALEDTVIIGAIMSVYWIFVFWVGGLYRNQYVNSPFDEFFKIIRLTFIGSVIFFFFIYVSSNSEYQRNPRFVFALYWVLLGGLVCIGRLSARQIQRAFRERGIIRIPVVLISTTDRIKAMLADVERELAWGYVVREIVYADQPEALKNLREVLRKQQPSEVLISMEHSDHTELLTIVAHAADSGCKVKIVPDMYEIVSGQARTQQIYGSPLIDVNPELMQPWEEAAKRTLDIVASFLILVIGMPVWLIVGAVVKFTSKGPIFYRQERVGRNGQIFKMNKFRSMYTDVNRAPSWTDKNDPRVTPFGRFIRATHLDEIPQMINVLKGEMSLVGPRPEQQFYVEKFAAILPYYRRRLKVRPGITGWWQVKTTSQSESIEEIEKRLRFDFFYIENISFKLDIEILVRTVFVMLQGHGRA